MLRTLTPSRPIAAALALTTLTAPLLASTAPPAMAVAPDRQSVVLALRPAAPGLLAHLAAEHPAAAPARRSALADAFPGTGRVDRVVRWLSGHGFTVEQTGPLTVTASARAATVAAALPRDRVPGALREDVRAVVTDSSPHRWHPHALPGGTLPATLTDAYARPAGDGTGATVATVQFSGWSELADPATGELADWAAAAGVALPAVTTVGVNGADPAADDGYGGETEVALDQEALLSVAPGASQRVYVTTNDAVGGVAVWDRILADVRNGVRITSVSTSWGACETDFSSRERSGVEQDVAALTALGVSVFAASGDTSAYDCSGAVGVDYPASSPSVVGVGGTNLTTGVSGYVETAWGGSTVDHLPGAGSGGGVSTLFARPAWQLPVATALSGGRVVPDIASEAAPSHGLAVLVGGGWYLFGGTSLSAPTQAGLLAAALADAGKPGGTPVEVHQALYGADAAGFRDITTGTNHVYAATAGYDAVTGLGAPQWSALVPALLGTSGSGTGGTGTGGGDGSGGTADPLPDPTDLVAPTALPRLAFADGGLRLRLGWNGADPAPSSGLVEYRVALKVRHDGVVRTVLARSFADAGRLLRDVRAHRSYRLVAVVVDAAGNTSARAATAWLRT